MKVRLYEAITPNKFARLMNRLELDLRQLQARSNTNPEELRDIALAMQAIEEISQDKDLTDGNVTQYSGTKYQKIIREKELELRSEALKTNPDVHKLASLFMLLKAIKRLASKQPEKLAELKEMSVSGMAAPDYRAASPVIKPIFPGSKSEFATDLSAMYGSSIKLSKEDKKSYDDAKRYVLSETRKRKI
jgi:hypothetical protein